MLTKLTWDKIRENAILFSQNWLNEQSEQAEAQTFWNEFFNVFGLSRRRIAVFEKSITKLSIITDQNLLAKKGKIDLFWPGTLIVEHKSKGKDLNKATIQAFSYFDGLQEEELPRFIIASDFDNFLLIDLDTNNEHNIKLNEFPENIHLFSFMLGQMPTRYADNDPVNIKAAQLMAKLRNLLEENKYSGHYLEVLLVRLMFCYFADDTGIFGAKDHFQYVLEENTKEDGSDFGSILTNIFQVLDTPYDKRQINLSNDLSQFPYVNGSLFEEILPIASFSKETRDVILQCLRFNWDKVSPAIFGSLFQSVMDKEERRIKGIHYTSERNIICVIDNLVLLLLRQKLKESGRNLTKLEGLLNEIKELVVLDPACGCGNFLVILYREIRLIEIDILKQIRMINEERANYITKNWNGINVDSMFGIEKEEFPCQVARVALWLIDHQMNIYFAKENGVFLKRIPLITSAKIINDNAFYLDWLEDVVNKPISFIVGNPPFIGKQHRTKEQSKDMEYICKTMQNQIGFSEIKNYNELDYVCLWYIKSAKYLSNSETKCAFVSTNSISQGEQTGILWSYLYERNLDINFAFKSFKWGNDAPGKANVYVVIISFSKQNSERKKLYCFTNEENNIDCKDCNSISPYLINTSSRYLLLNRKQPISNVPRLRFGSMPNDGGFLLLDSEEKDDILKKTPEAKKFIKPAISAKEFLNGKTRWCIWLKDTSPKEISKCKTIHERIKAVRNHRENSTREATNRIADTPMLFAEIRQPVGEYLLIPCHFSQKYSYIPIGLFSKDDIALNSCITLEYSSPIHFLVLSSKIHMIWVENMSGRIKMDYRYSIELVYNNFPWPKWTKKQEESARELVINLLRERQEYRDSSLGILYNKDLMPESLIKIHNEINRFVKKLYLLEQETSDEDLLAKILELANNSIEKIRIPI